MSNTLSNERRARSRKGAARAVAGQIGESAAVARESRPAFAVNQQAIESCADAAGNGRGPLRLGADGITEEIAAVPLYSSPIEIALDAEDEHVPLIVGADLAAAEKACTARESVASAGERIAPGGTAGTPANLSADIEAGPGIDRRRRGGDGCHRYPGKRQIGGGRGS